MIDRDTWEAFAHPASSTPITADRFNRAIEEMAEQMRAHLLSEWNEVSLFINGARRSYRDRLEARERVRLASRARRWSRFKASRT